MTEQQARAIVARVLGIPEDDMTVELRELMRSRDVAPRHTGLFLLLQGLHAELPNASITFEHARSMITAGDIVNYLKGLPDGG